MCGGGSNGCAKGLLEEILSRYARYVALRQKDRRVSTSFGESEERSESDEVISEAVSSYSDGKINWDIRENGHYIKGH